MDLFDIVVARTGIKPNISHLASIEYVDKKVSIFHAAIDNSTFQYIKGSADFTYEQAVNTENCQIEVAVANEKYT